MHINSTWCHPGYHKLTIDACCRQHMTNHILDPGNLRTLCLHQCGKEPLLSIENWLLVSHHDLGQKLWIQGVAIVGIGVLVCSKVLNLQRRNLIVRPCLDQTAVEMEVVILQFQVCRMLLLIEAGCLTCCFKLPSERSGGHNVSLVNARLTVCSEYEQ